MWVGARKQKIQVIIDVFECDCCGLCCRNLLKNPIYSDLDRGDGVCIYFNEITNLCNIYKERPDKCNVDKTYDLLFTKEISREEYYKLNYEACQKLKKERI